MPHNLPSYLGGHAAAILGVIAMHTGLAAWAMMPEPPVAIPQQQIIKVSMVAPTTIPQEPIVPQVPEPKKAIPTVPPKPKGMVKVKPEKKTAEKIEKKEQKKEEPKKIVRKETQTQLTSGLQSADSTQQSAAITKPAAADYLKNPPPEYPRAARRRKHQGMVMLDVLVTREGNPKHIKIERSSGYDSLDAAALAAVQHWQFVPARRGSEPVEASVLIPIEFRIN